MTYSTFIKKDMTLIFAPQKGSSPQEQASRSNRRGKNHRAVLQGNGYTLPRVESLITRPSATIRMTGKNISSSCGETGAKTNGCMDLRARNPFFITKTR